MVGYQISQKRFFIIMPTKTPKKNAKLMPPTTEPLPGEAAAAAAFGATLLVYRLAVAAGIIPPDMAPNERHVGEVASSLAAVGVAFDVAERTAANWASRGMPKTADGKYPLAAIRRWRLEQSDAPEWLERGNVSLPKAQASGDLARAILRVYRVDLLDAGQRARADFMAALADVDRSDDEAVELLFAGVMSRHFEGLRLSDAKIEQLLVEAWDLV